MTDLKKTENILSYELPGYTLQEVIFTNACTKIQRAIRNDDGCLVILKSFTTHFPNSRQRQRFLLSYDLLAKFEHPNITLSLIHI